MTVYKVIQVVGTSNTGFSDAVRGAVRRAGATLEDLRWFEVKELRGRIEAGEIAEFQVKVDIGFSLHASGKDTGEVGTRAKRGATRQARSAAAQASTRARRAR